VLTGRKLASALGECQGGVDQTDVRERLREIPQCGSRFGINLLS
jgi:hypothetical protein